MADINTEVPSWLQRNWSPRETFDPTPWLQQRYQRQIQAQQLPLQLQGMALQNQAHQLAVEHQGTLNDLQGIQMQQYQEEVPHFQELTKQFANDPVGLMNYGNPFSNPMLQKQWQDLQTSAAKTLTGIAAQEKVKQMWISARELQTTPGVPPIEIDPQSGLPTEKWIGAASAAKAAEKDKEEQLRYGYHYVNPAGAEGQGDAQPVKAQDTGEVIGYYVQGVHGVRFQPIHTSNPVISMQQRQKLKDDIDTAEESGDYAKADSLRDDLRFLSATHPGFSKVAKMSEADKFQVQSLYHRIGQINAEMAKIQEDPNNPDPSRKLALGFEAAKLQRQINAISGRYQESDTAKLTQPATAPSVQASPKTSIPKRKVYNPVTRQLE